jgi:predicted metal-binding protein
MQDKYEQQKLEAKQLAQLTAAHLLTKCNNPATAQLVLSLDQLLDKLGCHEKMHSKVPIPFYADTQETNNLMSGYYLFEFLKLHKNVYEDAKKLDILDRLSHYQREALEAHHKGKEKEFFKEHHYYANNK